MHVYTKTLIQTNVDCTKKITFCRAISAHKGNSCFVAVQCAKETDTHSQIHGCLWDQRRLTVESNLNSCVGKDIISMPHDTNAVFELQNKSIEHNYYCTTVVFFLVCHRNTICMQAGLLCQKIYSPLINKYKTSMPEIFHS